ncbi:hypothetical protein TRVL_01115 [Trypanosoma vivax]|nr:hypothetical protein TRVL_01115 [Trypanosoma vivax]
MGSGQSNLNGDVEAHLNKWENALTALEKMAASNSRAVEQDRMFSTALEDPRCANEELLESSLRGVCRSSQVSFSTVALDSEQSLQQRHSQRQMSAQGELGTRYQSQSVSLPASNNNSSNNNTETPKLGSSSGQPQKCRQQVVENRKSRMAFFKSYKVTNPDEVHNKIKCTHIGAVAVALSYLIGGEKDCIERKKRVTVEDIFFATQLPLHYIYSGVNSMQVTVDIIREFIAIDSRFKNEYGFSVVHFDISPTLGQVGLGRNDVGDRQTRMQLPEFTRLLSHECEEESNAIRIVNYDPYILEQETTHDEGEESDDDNTTSLAGSLCCLSRKEKNVYEKDNNGAYAIVVDVRHVVQLMVTLAEGVTGDELQVRLFEVPVNALFKAMAAPRKGERARGSLRIFRKDSVPVMMNDEVRSMFSPQLASGNVIGSLLQGTHASVVSTHISSHIIAVAWAMHLLGGVRLNAYGYGNGLPVSDIIRTMKFPTEVFIDGNLPLGEVQRYAQEYIKIKKYNYGVSTHYVLTNSVREDAAPTISVFDLEAIINDVMGANEDPKAPRRVMLIMYNAMVAHNMLNVAQTPHWCVLSGYDRESQMALLIDTHPKKFLQTWTCPLERLHRALTLNGYLIFSKFRKANIFHRAGLEGEPPAAIDSALHELLQLGAPCSITLTGQEHDDVAGGQKALVVERKDFLRTFHFPSLPLCPTMVALAITKLGRPTTFEDVFMALPFEASSLMLRYFTLECMAVCLMTYIERLGLHMGVKTYHTDRSNNNTPRISVEEFREAVVQCVLDNGKALVVLFNSVSIDVFGELHPFGSTGLVVGYNEMDDYVTVMDTNPNEYFRSWSIPINALFAAIHDTDEKNRRCGFLVLDNDTAPMETLFPQDYTRSTPLHVLPVRNVFHVSPSPHFQALSFAFAQLGFFCSPEQIFYEAYFKTVEGKCLRQCQAFAWRDVDVSLSVINKRMEISSLVQICEKFIGSLNFRSGAHAGMDNRDEKANEDTVEIEVVGKLDEESIDRVLRDATHHGDNRTVLLLNYDTGRVHDVMDWGRSAALVKAYDPNTRKVLLWEGEHCVFGLFWTIDLMKLIEIGDLHNELSSYGLIKFKRVQQRPGRVGATGKSSGRQASERPASTLSPATSPGLRRNREMLTKFI